MGVESTDHVFHRNFLQDYPIIERGEGVYLYDVGGKRYLDFCAGAAVASIGHGVKEIAQAMAEQAGKVAFAHTSRFETEPLRLLAAEVASLAPGDLNYVYFLSSGSEANEAAIKLSRQYHVNCGRGERFKVVGRWQSYHGVTLGALSAAGSSRMRHGFGPLLHDFPHIVPPDCYRCPLGFSHPECKVACARDLERVILQEGPETVSAFLVEPVVGSSLPGLTPPPDYFPTIRQICDKYGVLLIDDEVMAGFGRTGTYFATEHWNVVPDIITFGKGIAGGYIPLSGMVVSKKIVSKIIEKSKGVFTHGHTFVGSPITTATGLAVLKYMKEHAVVENARRVGQHLWQRLQEVGCHPMVGTVRAKGLLAGVELVADKATRAPFPPELRVADLVTKAAIELGVVFYPGGQSVNGVAGDHLQISPPLTISPTEVDFAMDALLKALDATDRLLKSNNHRPEVRAG